MNILQLTNKMPYPPRDGGAIATLNMSKGFTNLGHNVTILAMNTSKHYFDINNIPGELKEKIRIHDVKVNTRLQIIPALKNLLFSKIPYNAERFLCNKYKKKLEMLLRSNEYDVIQLEGLYLSPYIDIIKRNSKGLIALRAHNIEHEIWYRLASQERSILKKMYYKLIAKRIKRLKLDSLNKYDVLVPITKRDNEKFNNLGNHKPVKVIPAGIDTNKLIPDPGKINFPSICHIGTLDWMPNQEGLLWFLKNVWEELFSMHPGLKFNIAGRNAPGWICKYFDPGKNVNYFGEVDDAYEFMNKNAIMIVPLFSGSGMRVKIIEGMALGKTIITTTTGIEGIPAENMKDIIIRDTPGEFIKEIDNLIKNKKIFDEIGENAIKFVKENFDNTTISKDLIDFYSKLVK